MIKCPHCSGELDFDIKDQVVKCPYCESTFNPKEEIAKVKSAGERVANEYDTGVTKGKCYTCSQCGAQLVTFDDTAVTFCNYCDSQALIASEIDYMNPELIIPFKKTKEEAIALYKERIKHAIFAPSKFKSDFMIKKFRGIFMPYEIYDVECHGPVTVKAEKYSQRSGDYIYYDQYNFKMNVDATYDGLSKDLTSSYADDVSESIPFNFNECEEFNHNYLVGNYADTFDVNSDIYDDNVIDFTKSSLKSEIKKCNDLFGYTIKSIEVNPTIVKKRVGLFPVYFASYKTKDNKINYAVINGQTGKSAVDIPIDYFKYLVGVLLLSLVVFVPVNFILSLTAKDVCKISILTLIISAILVRSINSTLMNKITHKNDEGYLEKFKKDIETFNIVENDNKPKKKEKKRKDPSLKKYSLTKYFVLISIIPTFVIFLNPVDDLWYYGAGILALILQLVLFNKVIRTHNTLVSRPLPQLNKRGGDMNE